MAFDRPLQAVGVYLGLLQRLYVEGDVRAVLSAYGYHGAGTDHCAAAYRDARENNGAGADGCSLFNVRPKEPVGVSFASRKLVVAESGVRTYEDIIIDP